MNLRSLLLTVVAAIVTSCTSSSAPPEEAEGPELACSIPTAEIFSGGVGRDGIPALTNPGTGAAGAVPDEFFTTDRVLGLELNGAARAYPLPVLWWHEIVNDTLGGLPVLVSYCPLTGTGIAFDPRVDGGTRNFGVSGTLYRSNLIMFDRQTESLWNQMLLGSQCGTDRGKELQRIPVVETTLRHWMSLHPTSTVVNTETGFLRDYDRYPYGDYDQEGNEFVDFLSTGVTWDGSRPAKELVLGVFEGWADGQCRAEAGCESEAFPFGALAARGNAVVLNEQVGDRPILVTYQNEERVAIAYDRRLDGQLLTFDVATAIPMTMVDRETGTTWDHNGLAVEGALAGSRLEQLSDAYVGFWFAWSIFFPDISLVE